MLSQMEFYEISEPCADASFSDPGGGCALWRRLLFGALRVLAVFRFPAHFWRPAPAPIRNCCFPKLCDEDWLHIGILRVLSGVKTGRDFLQSMQANLSLPTVAGFFETLKSKRRLALCRDANVHLSQALAQGVPDAFAVYQTLAGFDLYASDGHSHAAAVHDAPQYSAASATKKAKFATSHIYTLNLRTHGLHHLAMADQVTRRKKQEMRTHKRLTLDQFRLGAPKGRRVLHVYDPACID